MKKVLVIAVLMCILCGCYRTVPTVEFETIETTEAVEVIEPVRSVPQVYFYPFGQTGQHKNVSLEVGEVEDMELSLEEFKISIPQEANLSSYFLHGEKLYYSYNFYNYIYAEYEKREERLLDEAYQTILMCYDVNENTTTLIAKYPNNTSISEMNVSGDYLSLSLRTQVEYPGSQYGSEIEYDTVIMHIAEDSVQEVELKNSAMLEQKFVSIVDGKYALTCNSTVRNTINKLGKINLETDIVEYIMLEEEYDFVSYSKGYLIMESSDEELHKIDIYDLDGEYVVGFKVESLPYDVVCNDKVCAWTMADIDGEGCLLYVYRFEDNEIFVMDGYKYSNWLVCDEYRVYFEGDYQSGISCYDSYYNAICKTLGGREQYEILSGEQGGIFGQVTDMLSSTIEINDGEMVYKFYMSK